MFEAIDAPCTPLRNAFARLLQRIASPSMEYSPNGCKEKNGAPPGTRTPNLLIKSQLLCQLS